MRSSVPAYDLKTPGSLGEALELLKREPAVWKPFAGGTDLMVLLEAGKLEHRKFFSIRHLPELQGIQATAGHMTLGALTTYTQAQRHPLLQEEFPMLCRAASETGGAAIQNRGTLGGNIVNASPAADSSPALLAYDAQLELVSSEAGSRWVDYAKFHTGYKKTDLQPNELLRSIRLPRTTKGAKQYYRKVGTRKAQAISKVCIAGLARVEGGVIKDIRIALGSVAPTVVRCLKTEAALKGRKADIDSAKTELSREIAPIDDIRSTAKYRLRVALNLLEEFLLGLKT